MEYCNNTKSAPNSKKLRVFSSTVNSILLHSLVIIPLTSLLITTRNKPRIAVVASVMLGITLVLIGIAHMVQNMAVKAILKNQTFNNDEKIKQHKGPKISLTSPITICIFYPIAMIVLAALKHRDIVETDISNILIISLGIVYVVVLLCSIAIEYKKSDKEESSFINTIIAITRICNASTACETAPKRDIID